MNYFINDSNEGYGYTDLALERRRVDTTDGVEYRKQECDGGTWEIVNVTSGMGARSIGRPIGNYYTLCTERMDLLGDSEIYDAREEVARRLCEMCEDEDIFPGRILVVGLGNANLTPDSVGVRAAYEVRPTLHILDNEPEVFEELECSEIAVCTPGVSAQTGMDSSEIVKSVARRLSPDLIICIDAIATKSPQRLGSTIQICNTGVIPGGGVGNKMGPIDYESTGIKVFSIGVPTVINSRVFCDTGTGMKSNFSSYSMLVSPKEIDEICKNGARIIGGAINQAFGIDDI